MGILVQVVQPKHPASYILIGNIKSGETMHLSHDENCRWWKDWHDCSCGYLEEEVTSDCLEMIPHTFGICGEDYGGHRQFCSQKCLEKAKGKT